MSNFTKEQLAELEDYFRQYLGGVEITAMGQSIGHGIGEYCISTPTGQGVQIYEQGNLKLVSNASIELVTGDNANKDTGHIHILCKNGDIHIEAPNGDLILEGKNVQIRAKEAKGSVTISSPHIIQTDASQLTLAAANVNVTADHSLYCLASYTTVHGENDTTIGEGHEAVLNGSLISRILHSVEEIKLFFKSICVG
jgi:hypothetical protein